MTYKYLIKLNPKVAKLDIPSLSNSVWQEVQKAINKKLSTNPVAFSKPLCHELKTYRSLRVGDYRVIFLIDLGVITIIAIGHRNKIYDITLERVN